MVTQKERVFLTIKEAERIINESNGKKEMVDKIRSLTKRQKAAPAPRGSIGIRQAARKYKMSPTTLSRWARLGWVDVVKTTPNWTYIDENSLIKAINRRKSSNN